MKKIICLALMTMGMATSCLQAATTEQLAALELEVRVLLAQRQMLQQNITGNRRKEMADEVRSQPKIKDYEWHAFTQQLQHAENYETQVQAEERALRAIDSRLGEIADQMTSE